MVNMLGTCVVFADDADAVAFVHSPVDWMLQNAAYEPEPQSRLQSDVFAVKAGFSVWNVYWSECTTMLSPALCLELFQKPLANTWV